MEISRNHLASALAQISPGYTLESARALSGRAHLLVVSAREGGTAQLALLTHSPADRLRNPEIARDEFRLLETLSTAGLSVAQPLYLAEDHAPPFFIAAWLPGSPRLAADDTLAFCRRLAGILTRIHAVDLARHELSFLPRQADRIAEFLDAEGESADERIRAAMRRVAQPVKPNASALLHGDFWLGNLLWQGEALNGILDWEDAMLGDPLGDLGKSRLEMLWALGEAAMREYTAQYLALNPRLDTGALPYWDLWGAARLSHYSSFAGDPGKVAAMRRQYDSFIRAAVDAPETGSTPPPGPLPRRVS